MNKLSEKILARLKVVATVVAVAVVAVAASTVVAPQRALAADVSDEWLSETDFSVDDSGVYHVKTAKGWYYFASASRDYDFDGATVVLDNDIDFAGIDDSGSPNSWAAITGDADDANAFTVGDDDMPFSGTFNGLGHTISNFDNHRDGLALQVDCGFFGQTNQATIKNVNFQDCYVGATYRGGLVAGYAQDTFFLNVTCTNCMASIIPPNNVLNLITNAGMSGGMICGEANGSTLYNCEVAGGTVVNNATSGVGALGGQPLYLGGLVGWCNDTVIEYSRVTDIRDEDDNLVHTSVENKYGTAVSVASYSEVFTGGIVGGMKSEDSGSKIVDCYCTADVYSEAAIYFAVGLGLGVTRGYTGGIVGIVQDGGDAPNLIQRVSYAGNLHSYNYNILLLGIPIIEHDKYMGGITGRGGNNATIDQAYFMRNTNDLGMGSSTTEDIYAVKTTYNGGYSDGAAYGPRDGSYASRDFWESCGFDFAGGTLRNVSYPFTPDTSDGDWNLDHYNKWVMDYTRGIPVHGGSIKATMDFPGSGMVTIGQTGLALQGSEQSTDDPYDFAVQGYEQSDESIELTYQFTSEKNDSWAADNQNQGFRFMGWYGSRDVRVNDIAEDHSLFTEPNSTLNTEGEGLLSNKYQVKVNEGDGQPDTLTVTYPEQPDNAQTGEYEDNDLYVAYAQAQVLLHDVNGNLVNTSGAAEEDATNDWYDYGDTITLPTSVAADVGQAGNFIGWTTWANTQDENDTGYAAIDSATLATLRADGVFWEPGDAFTVTEPANLYPVYSQYDNITVIYEGHDEGDLDTRTGYGSAVKTPGDDGLVLSVQPSAANSPLVVDTVRFLGWYEYVGDETTAEAADADTANWLRVSRGEPTKTPAAGNDCFTYNLTEAGVDLTASHIYKARFEYRVDYWAADDADNDATWSTYAQLWHTYNQKFQNIDGPDAGERAFWHWSEGAAPSGAGLWGCQNTNDAYNGLIIAPATVHAHYDPDTTSRQITATTDFPTGPAVTTNISDILELGQIEFVIASDQLNAGIDSTDRPYWFHGWTGDSDHTFPPQFYETHTSTTWDEGGLSSFSGSYNYWYEAHVTARVNFHGVPADGGQLGTTTVSRRYEQPVFLAKTCTDPYTYHYSNHQDDATGLSSTNAAFPYATDMSRAGYVFLGWIETTDPEVKSALDLGVATQFEDDTAYLASSVDAVSAYLMTGDEKCARPMDLYPVYAQFNLETTTNIAEAGVDSSTYNIPDNPTLGNGNIDPSTGTVTVDYNTGQSVELSYNAAGQAQVQVTVDTNTNVWITPPDGTENNPYTFLSLSVIEDGVEVATISADQFGEETDGARTTTTPIPIETGHSYVFRANYSPVPVLVTYHLNGNGDDTSTEQFSCEVGNLLPSATGTPSFTGYGDFFYGWTVGDASGSAQAWNKDIVLAQPGVDRVIGTMHLWPVYRDADVTVNSNIDEAVEPNPALGTVRADDSSGYWISAKQTVTGTSHDYEFVGWIRHDDDTTVPGPDNIPEGQQYFSQSTEVRLSGDERFDGQTYTAIYRQVEKGATINYHGPDGNVLYSVNVPGDSGRTFVTQIEVPQYDEDGNIVTGPDGSQQTTTVTTPIDYEAFTLINSYCESANAADDATTFQQFIGWQMQRGGNWQLWNTEDSNNFVNQEVVDLAGEDHVVDLYPVMLELSAKDSEDPDSIGINDLGPQPVLSDAGELEKLNITLAADFSGEWLIVHVDQVAYGPDATGDNVPRTSQTNVPVNLYATGSTIGEDAPVASATTAEVTSVDATTGQQIGVGDALFTFSGRITINKQTTDPNAAGKTLFFMVADQDDTDAEPVTVAVTVGDESLNGVYSGSATIAVPFGSYTVTEDTGWAWRYDAKLQTWVADADPQAEGPQPGWSGNGESADVTVQYESAITPGNPDGTTAVVRAENDRVVDKWFDGEDYKHNVFGTKGGE